MHISEKFNRFSSFVHILCYFAPFTAVLKLFPVFKFYFRSTVKTLKLTDPSLNVAYIYFWPSDILYGHLHAFLTFRDQWLLKIILPVSEWHDQCQSVGKA